MRAVVGSAVVAFSMFMAAGCATAPESQAQRRSLVSEARASLDTMVAQDPGLQDVIDRSAGYAVFPDIGAAGAVVGGAYGRGVLFEAGRPAGFVELNQGSVGALIGGQTYSELIVFHNDAALNGIKAGDFDLGAEASAVALKAGVAAATRLEDGFSIFQMPKGGLMASAAVTGQKFSFAPMQESFEQGDEAVTASSRMSAERSNGSFHSNGNRRPADEASAYQVDRNLQPSEEMKLRTDTGAAPSGNASRNASHDASAYQVDQNLRPSEEIKLQTGNDARESARDAARDQNK
jgi:lipid-binding SYLF domain-containing protein